MTASVGRVFPGIATNSANHFSAAQRHCRQGVVAHVPRGRTQRKLVRRLLRCFPSGPRSRRGNVTADELMVRPVSRRAACLARDEHQEGDATLILKVIGNWTPTAILAFALLSGGAAQLAHQRQTVEGIASPWLTGILHHDPRVLEGTRRRKRCS